jgi:putative ABC transport system substrate-binding protein
MLFVLSIPAQAQQVKPLFRVGFISPEHSGSLRTQHLIKAFQQGLRDFGYVEGQHVTIEYQYAGGIADRFSQIATDLVAHKVDTIIVVNDQAIIAAKAATKSIPIIMVSGGRNPVDAGFVNSLAHPGGNVTGFTNLGVEMGEKRLELFKEAVPQIKRVAAIYDPTNRGNVVEVKDILPRAAHQFGLTIEHFEVGGINGFERAFTAITKDRVDGLYLPGGPLLNDNDKRTADFALNNRLPSVYLWSESVDVGGLLSYGPSYMVVGKGIARFVDRIIKGAKPGDLPVEQPTKFDLVINLKTAKHIGVTIPPNVLARADKVIK